MFAENVEYCLELGVKDAAAGCVVLWSSKTRSSDTEAAGTVLRYTSYGRLENASEEYMIDPDGGRRIVSKEYASSWAGLGGEEETSRRGKKAAKRAPAPGPATVVMDAASSEAD